MSPEVVAASSSFLRTDLGVLELEVPTLLDPTLRGAGERLEKWGWCLGNASFDGTFPPHY